MRAAEFAERMQRLDHARALRPTAACAGGQRNHGDFALRAGLPHPRLEDFSGVPLRPDPWYRCTSSSRTSSIIGTGRRDGSGPDRCAPRAGRRESVRVALRSKPNSSSSSVREICCCRMSALPRGQHVIEQRLDHAAQFRLVAAGRAEFIQFGAAQRRRACAVPAATGAAPSARNSRPASSASLTVSQIGERAVLVDREIINHRLHGEGQGVLTVRASCRGHDFLQPLLSLGFSSRARR